MINIHLLRSSSTIKVFGIYEVNFTSEMSFILKSKFRSLGESAGKKTVSTKYLYLKSVNLRLKFSTCVLKTRA